MTVPIHRLSSWLLAFATAGAPTAFAKAAPGDEQKVAAVSVADREEAQALRTRAEEAFFAGDYDEAIVAFKEAHELSSHATDLFNLGRVHEEKGDLADALEYYEAFAALPRLSLEQRAAAAERIEVLRKIVDRPDEVDDRRPLEAPPPQPARDPRYDQLRDPTRALIITGGALAGVGAALAIGGGVGFGLWARRSGERVTVLSSGQNPDRLKLSDAEDLHTQGRNAEALQITFIATGGALAVIGGSLLATGLIKRRNARLTAVAPSASPTALGATAHWRF